MQHKLIGLPGLLALLLLSACGAGSAETSLATSPVSTTSATVTPQAASAVLNTPTFATTLVPATVAPTATFVPTTTAAPTNTAAPTATIVPTKAANLLPRYIEALRNRSYNGGEIKLDRLYARTEAYTAHLIYYQSDGLKISGLMFVPNGPVGQKYPVALVNHGYFKPTPADYDSGWDTLRELMFFARNGYITIASDYRNYARSDKGDNEREPGYVADILNLIEAVKKFPQADPNRITMMGHSMGGEITLTAMVVSKDIKVAGLFGTMSPNAADNYYARIGWNNGSRNPAWEQVYTTPDKNPEAYRLMSPLTYFNDVKVPAIIHVGTNDTTTPPAWSVKTRDALTSAGKRADLYTYPGQGHSLNGASFDQAMQRTLSFFNAAIGR